MEPPPSAECNHPDSLRHTLTICSARLPPELLRDEVPVHDERSSTRHKLQGWRKSDVFLHKSWAQFEAETPYISGNRYFYPPSLFKAQDDNSSCKTECRFGFVVWCLLPAQCPHDWLANGRSCYSVRRSGLIWSDAQHRCGGLTTGGHLADLTTPEDLLFVSSHLLTEDNLLLLWTGLNDQQVFF